MTVEMGMLIGQLLLKYGPEVAMGVTAIFQKKDPTLEDWNNVFTLAKKSYAEYVAPKV